MGCYDSAFYPQRSYPQAFVTVCFLQDEVHDVSTPRDYIVRWTPPQGHGAREGLLFGFIGLGVALLCRTPGGIGTSLGVLCCLCWSCGFALIGDYPGGAAYCTLYIIWLSSTGMSHHTEGDRAWITMLHLMMGGGSGTLSFTRSNLDIFGIIFHLYTLRPLTLITIEHSIIQRHLVI